RPETSNEQTSWPWSLTLNEELLKFPAAEAVEAPNANRPVTAIAKITKRRNIFPSLGIKRCFRRISCASFVVGFTLLGEFVDRNELSAKGRRVDSAARRHL